MIKLRESQYDLYNSLSGDDWNRIIRENKLSENFMRFWQHKMDWDLVFIYQKYSKEFSDEFACFLKRPIKSYENESRYKNEYNNDPIELNPEKYSWLEISKRCILTESDLYKYLYKLDFDIILSRMEVSEQFLRDNLSFLLESVHQGNLILKQNGLSKEFSKYVIDRMQTNNREV